MVNNTFKLSEISSILQKHYSGTTYKFTTDIMKTPPPDNSLYELLWGRYYRVDNYKSNSILGLSYRNIDDTLIAAADAMIDSGQITDLRINSDGP